MKKLISKKIVALIVAVVAIVSVYGYTQVMINSKMKPTRVVVAKEDIPPNTKITKEMLYSIVLPGDGIPKSVKVAHDVKDVLGKYTVPGYGISKTSMIYLEKIQDKSQRPDNAVLSLKPTEHTFSFKVDTISTHGSSLIQGQVIDLYTGIMIKDSVSKINKPFFGRVVKGAKIVSVKDVKGNEIYSPEDFTNLTEEEKKKPRDFKPHVLTVAVDLNSLQYLNKARMMGAILPVANGLSLPEETTKELLKDIEVDSTVPMTMNDVEETRKIILNYEFQEDMTQTPSLDGDALFEEERTQIEQLFENRLNKLMENKSEE